MARSVNKVILIGHLGQDPEARTTPGGVSVCTISIATSESWKDKDGGKQEKTEWHKVVFWNKLADIAAQYLTKGSLVYIEGKLQTRKWQASDGSDRYTTEIVAGELQMLGGGGDRKESPPPPPAQAQKRPPQPEEAPAFDDEIPF